MSCDFCAIGHVTRDHIERTGQPPTTQPGGTTYYAGLTARRLGLDTAVVTALRLSDQPELLGELEDAGVRIRCVPSACTTVFVNRYPEPRLEAREQEVEAVARPFRPEDLQVTAEVYLVGPLTQGEVPAACLERLAERPGRVALDVQGYLRILHDGRVVTAACADLQALLRYVDVVKADDTEARYATGAASVEEAARLLGAAGPREVVVTSGRHGSLVWTPEETVIIPAYPPLATVDLTGSGDTYFAAYLARRLAGDSVEAAGHFAAAAASLKISTLGAFQGTAADCRTLLADHAPRVDAGG